MRTPIITAKLLILICKSYEKEKEKELTRFRFSRKTLGKCAGRERIKEAFIMELENALYDLGWILIQVNMDSYAIIRLDKASTWVRLSTKRLRNGILDKNPVFLKDDEEIDQIYDRYCPSTPDTDSEEDD